MNEITTARTITADYLEMYLGKFHPSIKFHKALDILSPVPLRDDYLEAEGVDFYNDEAVKCALMDYIDLLNSRAVLMDRYTNFMEWMTAGKEWFGLNVRTRVTTKDVEGCALPFLEIEILVLNEFNALFRSGGIVFHPTSETWTFNT